MKARFLLCATLLALAACSGSPRRLTILSTGDTHGAVFDTPYAGGKIRPSMIAASTLIDSVRTAEGADNVLLIDAGDFLQGDNCVYYFNFVDTLSEHLCPRIFAATGYDAVLVGNHDIEPGHAVYDRVARQFAGLGIPFLAANAVGANSEPYFGEYALFKKAGLKVLVLGCTNANIKHWLAPSVWEGIEFLSLVPFVQEEVSRLQRSLKPDVTVVAVHSGAGDGSGRQLESQGLELLNSLEGVDVIICAHDHHPCVEMRENICMINSGARLRYVARAVVEGRGRHARKERRISADLLRVNVMKPDTSLRAVFRADFEAVRDFTLKPVATLDRTMFTRDAFRGQSPYLNLIHTVQLRASGADISIAAPLSYNKTVQAGQLVFNDMFTLYSYENQLYTVSMTGNEVRNYLEYAYDQWIGGSEGHVLKILPRDDPRTGARGWSFRNRTYNFDSAAGICYTVDVTRPRGERVKIKSMADGSPFNPDRSYRVAMNSYRASGGAFLKASGQEVKPEAVEARILQKQEEVRTLMYKALLAERELTPAYYSNPALLGSWSFVPASERRKIDSDFKLVFPNEQKLK